MFLNYVVSLHLSQDHYSACVISCLLWFWMSFATSKEEITPFIVTRVLHVWAWRLHIFLTQTLCSKLESGRLKLDQQRLKVRIKGQDEEIKGSMIDDDDVNHSILQLNMELNLISNAHWRPWILYLINYIYFLWCCKQSCCDARNI